jgi:hypothetical protein
MAESLYGFGPGYIDVDGWRDEPRRHRYVHGGFEDTHTRFSMYLPPAELYQGRYFQFLQGGAGGFESSLAQGWTTPGISGGWVFDVVFDELGGYLVESNQGHLGNEGNLGLSGEVELYGASAETSLYSRVVAEEMYGTSPHHGYLWGPSGGGLRTLTCIENRPDAWDGASPHVIGGSGGANSWSAWAYWWLYCRDKKADIIDATAPGGSGDPYATLTNDEREALATLYRRGWPRGAENQLGNFFSWLFTITALKGSDPAYFDEFWTDIGYLGHDNPETMAKLLVDETLTVTRTLKRGAGEEYVMNPIGTMAVKWTAGSGAGAIGLRSGDTGPGSTFGIVVDAELDDPDKIYLAKVTVLTGAAKGREVHISCGPENSLIGFGLTQPDVFDGVEPGDTIRLDNRDLIAFAHMWKYTLDLEAWTVEDPVTGERTLATEYGGVNATMVDGRPVFPTRPSGLMAGGDLTGRFESKMIHVVATHDVMVMPAWVPSYERLVRSARGDAIDDYYRLWWAENATHGSLYSGMTAQAFRDLVGWVEDGTSPAVSTTYLCTTDGAIVLPESATERGGVQPVVQARANDGVRAEVATGEPVTFVGTAQQPPGRGSIVSARWEFEEPLLHPGFGEIPEAGPEHVHEISEDTETITVQTTHTYAKPGTYFPVFHVAGHRDGLKGEGLPVENVARVRVVVT